MSNSKCTIPDFEVWSHLWPKRMSKGQLRFQPTKQWRSWSFFWSLHIGQIGLCCHVMNLVPPFWGFLEMPYVAGSQTFNDGDVGHDVMRWPNRHVAMQTKRKSECQEIYGEVIAKIGMSKHLSSWANNCFRPNATRKNTPWTNDARFHNAVRSMFCQNLFTSTNAMVLKLQCPKSLLSCSWHEPKCCTQAIHMSCSPIKNHVACHTVHSYLQEIKDYFFSCSCTYGIRQIITQCESNNISVQSGGSLAGYARFGTCCVKFEGSLARNPRFHVAKRSCLRFIG